MITKAQVETALRRFISHPRKRMFVIFLTIGVVLMTVLPATDKYGTLSEKEAELRNQLTQAKTLISNGDQQRALLEKRRQQLKEEEAKAATADEIQQLRADLVTWIRNDGCRLRRIEVGQVRRRTWRENDSTITAKSTSGPDNPDTDFILRSQSVVISVSGEVAKVHRLLARIADVDMTMHTERIAIRPIDNGYVESGANAVPEVMLDMTLTLFDLEKKAEPPAA